MNKFNAGRFSADVSSPYPCWIDFYDGMGNRIRIAHAEISDAIYVLTRAKNEAKRSLKGFANEVD